MTHNLVKAAAATAFAIATIAAHAQPANTGTPANVGVSQGTAAEAASKAVPRADTGTLVRTGPDAGNRAGAAADSARSTMGTPSTAPVAETPAPAPMQRARKADRN